MRARHAKVLTLLSLSVVVGVSLLTSVAGATQSGWLQLGDEMEIDLPSGFGSYKDVRKDRPGVQINVHVLRKASEHKLRFASGDNVVGEAADGGFKAEDSLSAGWRAFAWGDDASGTARLWTLAFDSGHTLLSTDPGLPCGKALDRTTPLAGPLSITIPTGARPGGNSVASPASVFVYGDLRDPDRGVRVATANGVKIGERKNRPIARGAFVFANAVFVYGTNGRNKPRLLTPELDGKSTALVQTGFVPCKPASPQGTITVTKKLVPADDSGRFDLLVDGTAKKTGAGDGGTTGAVSVPAGSHSISETASAGGTLDDYATMIDCVGTDEAGPLASSTTSLEGIPVEAGDDWQCTITNTRKAPFDGNVTPVKDGAHAASAAIGPAGGTITASGMTLSVPAGALHDEQTITLTPLSSIGGSPFHDLIGAVEMEPQGLHFLVPATLTIPRPAGVLDSQIVGFGFSEDGTGFHLKPNDLSSGPITLQVLHFSGGGAANATLTEVNHTLGYEPTPAQELAEQQIAAAEYREAQDGTDPNPAIVSALADWFDHSVSTGLGLVGGSLDNLELALGEWVAWVGEVEAHDLAGLRNISDRMALGQKAATDDAAHIADLLLVGCTGAGARPLESLRPVVRLSADLQAIAASRAAEVAIESRNTADGRVLPSATALPSSCAHVKIEGITHAPLLAFLHDNSYTADAGVVFWNATDPNHSIPLVLTVFDQTEGQGATPPTLVTDGQLKTTVKPTSLGNHTYELTADLEAAAADDTLKPLSDRKTDTVPVRARIDLRSDATIKPGETVHLKALLAGDGMVNGTVTYTLAGVGSLSASSGTTDANGETEVDYTAPSDNHPATAGITASFDDGTGPVVGFAKITIKPDVKVVVTPATIQLSAGGTTQFSATVTGVNDSSVTWSKSGGTIDQSGLYTAPQSPGTFTVTATSNEDPTAKDSATVTVVSSGTVTVTARVQNANASAEAYAARLDGTVDQHVLGVDNPHSGLGSFTSTADPGSQGAAGDGGATAHATAHAEVQADVSVTGGRLSATVGSISVNLTTTHTQGEAIDPVDGLPTTLNALAYADAVAGLTVEFTVSGQPVPFGCFAGGDARLELRSNGQQVFLGSAQATLPTGSYSLTVSLGARAASLPIGFPVEGRPETDQKSGSAACA